MSSTEDHGAEYDSSSSVKDKGKGKADPRSVKKRKLNRACDACRKRKVRCDFVELPSGNLNKCLNCFSGKVECTFSEDSKSRPNAKKDVRALEAKVKRAEALLARLCPDEKTRQALLDGALDSTRATPGIQDGQHWSDAILDHAAAALRARMSRISKPDSDEENDEESEDAPRLVPSLDFDVDPKPRYFMGESSDPGLIIRALRAKKKWKSEASSLSEDAKTVGKAGNDTRPFSRRRHMFWTTYPWEHASPAILHDNVALHTFRFPDPPLMDSLLSLYFEHFNLLLPLIHRPTLERELREGLHHANEAFATTVLVMCALGARYSDDPAVFLNEEDVEQSLESLRSRRTRSTSPEDLRLLDAEIDRMRDLWRMSLPHSRGWKYFEQAWDARGSLKVVLSPSLYDIQFYALSSLFLRNTSFPHACWTILGVGLRLLLDIGGHRRIRDPSRTMNMAEEELLKRACWVIVSLERMISMATGRPCAIRPEELDMKLPTECDDEYWEVSDPQQAWKQPPDKPSLLTAFTLNIRLLEILGTVLRTIYATKSALSLWAIDKSEVDKKVVTEVDSALNTWLGTLPPHLVWDPYQTHKPFLVQSAMLHATYYHVQILLHRPFIPTPTRPARLPFPSLAICTNAARSISRVCITLLERVGDVPGDLMLAIFSGGIVLLLKAWHTRQSHGSAQQFKKEMDEVKKCLTILHAMEKSTFLSGKLWDILNGLSNGGEVTIMPCLQQPSAGATSGLAEGSPMNMKREHLIPISFQPNSRSSLRLDTTSSTANPAIGPGVDQETPTAANWNSRRDQQGLFLTQPALPPQGLYASTLTSLQPYYYSNFAPRGESGDTFSPLASSGLTSGMPHFVGQSSMFSSMGLSQQQQQQQDGRSQVQGHNAGQSRMFVSSTQGGVDIHDMVDLPPFPSLASTDPPDADMSNLWDWGIPFQEDDPVAYLVSDSLMRWQTLQMQGMMAQPPSSSYTEGGTAGQQQPNLQGSR